MKRKKPNLSPSSRLKTAATLLAAAQKLDTKSVQDRLDAFTKVHAGYCDAHGKVGQAQVELRAAQKQLAQLDAEQDTAVEALALSLAINGQPREKPFEAFGADTPNRIKNMSLGDEVQAIHTLVASVRADRSLPPATLEVAQHAEDAARKVEAVLVPLTALRNNLIAARQLRDNLAPAWDTSIAVLRRAALAADDIDAPGLYLSLFGRRNRATKKTKPAAHEAATGQPAATATPAAVA